MYEKLSTQKPLTPEDYTLALQRFLADTSDTTAKLAYWAIGTHSEESALSAMEEMEANTAALAAYGGWLESLGMVVMVANPQGQACQVLGFAIEGFGYAAHAFDPSVQAPVTIEVTPSTPIAVMALRQII